MELEETVRAEGRVVALNRLQGRGKASGAAVDAEVGCIFEFEDGRISRMVFCDRHAALKAAGRAQS
jgi:ketosteroid isomerase-like protein